MYTWGYLKDVILAKLDLDAEEALTQDLVRRFKFFANEAMTQICSAVKPRRDFAEFVITAEDVGTSKVMPNDFISFGDDVNQRSYQYNGSIVTEEAHDDVLRFLGYNKIVFYEPGTYHISYNARWYDFVGAMSDETQIDVPCDILDCIPSYVASQCFKIDNEYKSSVYRNEYEMGLARIDNTDFKNTSTFRIGGDW